MKKIVFVVFLIVMGCSDPGEQASANLKKGDEFYAKNEYEIAEYYYEKIPEDSPFYRQAKKKLDAIAAVKETWKVVESEVAGISQAVLVDNKYKTDNVSRVPIHTITIANHSKKELGSVSIEFVYYNGNGGIIKTLIGEVKTELAPNSQNTYDNVSPGILPERFVKCNAKIIKAHFSI